MAVSVRLFSGMFWLRTHISENIPVFSWIAIDDGGQPKGAKSKKNQGLPHDCG